MTFAIIGAGMAGLACADALRLNGQPVALFDKGRCAGGRMSTRRLQTQLGEVTMDYGAQYFTARDPAFKALTNAWQELGIVAPWPLAGVDAFVGVPGMNELVRTMASSHEVKWSCHVAGVARRDGRWWLLADGREFGPFEAVVLAIPAEQAAALLSLHDLTMARIALTARSQPCWTTMLVFDFPLDILPSVIRNRGIIAWAARNNAKPSRPEPEAWVVQASANWSSASIEKTPAEISGLLYAALAEAAGSVLPRPIAAVSHRWRYALSAGTREGALWNPDIGLGACGDWLLGPRVECAWLSGRMLANFCGVSEGVQREDKIAPLRSF